MIVRKIVCVVRFSVRSWSSLVGYTCRWSWYWRAGGWKSRNAYVYGWTVFGRRGKRWPGPKNRRTCSQKIPFRRKIVVRHQSYGVNLGHFSRPSENFPKKKCPRAVHPRSTCGQVAVAEPAWPVFEKSTVTTRVVFTVFIVSSYLAGRRNYRAAVALLSSTTVPPRRGLVVVTTTRRHSSSSTIGWLGLLFYFIMIHGRPMGIACVLCPQL